MTKRNHITEQELIEITNRKSLENAIERFSSRFEEHPMRVVEAEEPKETWEHLTIGRFIIMTIGLIAFLLLLGRMEYLAYWC